jgi:hypothetical protein
MLNVSPLSSKNRFRTARVDRLSRMMSAVIAVKGLCKVLDIGGTRHFWSVWQDRLPIDRATLDCLNLDPNHSDSGETRRNVTVQAGDGRTLAAIVDRGYGIVFSNSVIEHVGGWNDMLDMAAEVRRVCDQYIVQTPNYRFPIDPHARLPLFQFLPKRLQYRIVMWRKCGFWEKANSLSEAREIVHSA